MKLPDFFTVKVSKEHIDEGAMGDAGACAVSLALLEYTDKTCEVTTRDVGPITVKDPNTKHVYNFCFDEGMLSSWVYMFDNGFDVPPIEIDFEVEEIDDEYGNENTDPDTVAYIGEARIIDICETLELYEQAY